MVVDQVEKGFDLDILISLILEDQVAIFFDLLFISKLQELNVNFKLILDSFDQDSIHKVSVLKHLECQFSSFLFKAILDLKLFADLIHQVDKTNQILKSFKVLGLVAVDEYQCLLDFIFDQNQVSLEIYIDVPFSHSGCFIFIGCFIKKSDVLD